MSLMIHMLFALFREFQEKMKVYAQFQPSSDQEEFLEKCQGKDKDRVSLQEMTVEVWIQ